MGAVGVGDADRAVWFVFDCVAGGVFEDVVFVAHDLGVAGVCRSASGSGFEVVDVADLGAEVRAIDAAGDEIKEP